MINWIKAKIDFHNKRFNPNTASVDDAIVNLLNELNTLIETDIAVEDAPDVEGTYKEGFLDGYLFYKNFKDARTNSATGSRVS
jgi:hypothetical protein